MLLMLFTHVCVKELQNYSGLCLVWQCLSVSYFFEARVAEGSSAVSRKYYYLERVAHYLKFSAAGP